MKIAIDVSQIVYNGTGVGRYTYNLAESLLRLGGADYIFYAGVFRQKGYLRELSRKAPWNLADWRITPIPPKLATHLFNHTSIPIDSVIGDFDLLHTSDWVQPVSHRPTVTTVHDLAFRLYPETVDHLILSTHTKRMERVVQYGAHIIADSQSTKNDLMKIYNLNPDIIDVIYPGIESRFTPQKKTEIDRVKNKYHLPKKYLLSLGTKEPRKNLPRLVEAVEGLPIPLVVTGRHGWGESLNGKNIIETDYVDDADLPGLYSGATSFIFPSLYEGFGFPVGEAMACGTAVVTSNVSSLSELVGSSGILVDPSSTQSIRAGIVQSLDDTEKLKNARIKQASKFTWNKTAKATLAVYKKILNKL